MTIFHHPKRTGLYRGLHLARRCVELSNKRGIPIEDAVQIVVTKKHLNFEQAAELRKLARERQERGL